MPLYLIATYLDAREEWAVRADNLEQARALVGDDPNGDWLTDAVHLDTEAVACRDEFVTDFDERPLIEEITPGHWAWHAAHRKTIDRSLRQNIAAISGDLHTHRLYEPFYETFGERIGGFIGPYDLCMNMAEALTEWEVTNGLLEAYENAGVSWIEVVENFVDTVLARALDTDTLPDPVKLLADLRVFRHLH